MDFNSMGSGSPFYVLRKSKPSLSIGTVKSKTNPQPKLQTGATVFNGNNIQQVVNITVTIDDKDEVFADVPTNAEVAQTADAIFTGSQTAMTSVVENFISQSRKALEMVDYHKSVLTEGDKMLEQLNPKYADDKRQARTIAELEKRQTETDKKLDKVLAMLTQMTNEKKSNTKP